MNLNGTMRNLIRRLIAEDAEGNEENPQWLRRGSVVCLVTDCILGGELAWLGHASPDQGGCLVKGAAMFDDLGAQIAALVPDSGWQGSAARAYGAHTLAQSRHSTLMADLDRLAAELVSSQADDVKQARTALWAAIGFVSAYLLICLGIELQGPEGQLLSFNFAVVVCGAVLGISALVLHDLAKKTSRRASSLQTTTQRLSDMAAGVPTRSDMIPGAPEMSLPPAHSLSEFDLIDSSAASPPHLPDLDSAFADLPGAPEFHLPTAAGAGLPDFGAPQLPIPALTGLPTLPTIAQLSTTLSQLANTATQHAQMISTLAQQGAHQHTTLTDHHTTDETPDTDAATAATSSGERAPLDTTTHPTQHRLDHIV
ncbi:EspA/EspE family type VII secretion system effector [Mycobacterium marinum]|uniref:EspA/EspE family type VII secretion system effector n=1 Tax=Mycobacterium marinum TaxID=1781 RepID=UPI002358B6F3|nr:EspA/EspE family type VII secretion system effector [Mycobacterium marinum]MDC8975749.1 EspA/EspE family type VII secretion system effector [Mycobacterium marinum]